MFHPNKIDSIYLNALYSLDRYLLAKNIMGTTVVYVYYCPYTYRFHFSRTLIDYNQSKVILLARRSSKINTLWNLISQ